MMIKETVHHGNYRNVRVVELPDPVGLEDVREMALTCPYRSAPHYRHMRDALRSGGSYSHGWVTWEVAAS